MSISNENDFIAPKKLDFSSTLLIENNVIKNGVNNINNVDDISQKDNKDNKENIKIEGNKEHYGNERKECSENNNSSIYNNLNSTEINNLDGNQVNDHTQEEVKPLELTEETSFQLKSFIEDINTTLTEKEIEQHYLNKEQLVSELMYSLHLIIKEVDLIKQGMPKPKQLLIPKKSFFPKPSTSNFKNLNKTNNLNTSVDMLNTSGYSRRSLTSSRTKYSFSNNNVKNNSQSKIGSKISSNNLKQEIVPNKYQIMSPKVSINIGLKSKKNNNSSNANSNANSNCIELNIDDKKLKKNGSVNKLDKINNQKSSVSNNNKKPNTKKTNLSTPNAKFSSNNTNNNAHSNNDNNNTFKKLNNKKPTNTLLSSSMKTPKKPIKITHNSRIQNEEEEQYPSLEDSMRLSSTYKFEPKKKHFNINNTNMEDSNYNLNSIELNNNERKELLNDSSISKKLTNTRNSSNNINQSTADNNSSANNYLLKSIKNDNNMKEIPKFKCLFSHKYIKDLFTNNNNIAIIKRIFSFMKIKEKKKLRNISLLSYSCFVDNEIEIIEKEINYRQNSSYSLNPLIGLSSDFSKYCSSNKNSKGNFNDKANRLVLMEIFDYINNYVIDNKEHSINNAKKNSNSQVNSSLSNTNNIITSNSNINLINSFISFTSFYYILYFIKNPNTTETVINNRIKNLAKDDSTLILSLKQQIQELDAQCYKISNSSNLYSILPVVLANARENKTAYNMLKLNIENCCISLNSCLELSRIVVKDNNLKPFIEIIKQSKNLLENNLNMVNLVEAEILASKIDKLRKKFPVICLTGLSVFSGVNQIIKNK